MHRASNAKKVNLIVILLGFVFVLMGQTWVSVLNAEQTYLLSEARRDESRILKVEDRLQEIFNTLNNPEYAYTAATLEGYNIALKPKENLTVDDFIPWSTRGDMESLEYLVDEKTNHFIQTHEEFLPARDKTYFKPISESLKENGLSFPVETFEALIASLKSLSVAMGEGFGGTPEVVYVESENSTPEAINGAAADVESISGESPSVLSRSVNTSAADSINIEPKFGGDIPAPVTR